VFRYAEVIAANLFAQLRRAVYLRAVRTDDRGHRATKKPAGPNADWVDAKTMGLTLRSTRDADVAHLATVQAGRPLKPSGR
jgi:hypothetical protein